MTKIAAIDIGSNGMRMVLGQVEEAWAVETVENIRLDHEVHGHYLLSSTRLIGLTAREQDMVASLVLNHRKQSHSTDEKSLKALPQKDRLIVSKLLALLRLADSLDIS